MAKLLPVFTVGHSTRSIDEFASLLGAGRVQLVVDIRRIPRSRTNPQYNLETLGDALEPFKIACIRIESLGGLRKREANVAVEVNGFWENRSFHNYADYALSDTFRAGMAELLETSRTRRTAIMCAEAVWWRCHRRIIADYLIFAGRDVYHLMGEHDVKPATPTPAAIKVENGLHYPAG